MEAHEAIGKAAGKRIYALRRQVEGRVSRWSVPETENRVLRAYAAFNNVKSRAGVAGNPLHVLALLGSGVRRVQ